MAANDPHDIRRRVKQVIQNHRNEIFDILDAHEVTDNGHDETRGVYRTTITRAITRIEVDEEDDEASEDLWILNPLKYTQDYDEYIDKLLGEEVVALFVAMNPTIASLTAIPFYQLETFQPLLGDPLVPNEIWQWIGNQGDIDSVSGERFGQLIDMSFEERPEFFDRCFIINFCPLIFVTKDGNGNFTNKSLEKLVPENGSLLGDLLDACDKALQEFIKCLMPELIVAVGGYAHDRVKKAVLVPSVRNAVDDVKTIRIQHPGYPGHRNSYPGNLEDRVRQWKFKANYTLEQNEIWTARVYQQNP